jgi:organic hydroperoxide reductase OsmC/OhrA
MHTYEVDLKWTSKSKGLLSSTDLQNGIEVAIPPEFPGGIKGVWSPEHLFVASLNSCLMTTFLTIAGNSKLHFTSFDCKAICNVDHLETTYFITEVILKPKIVIPYSEKPDRAKRIIEMSKNACMISNAVKVNISLEPEIIVEQNIIPVSNSY